MYDVCIRKNRHGDWVAVIKWTTYDENNIAKQNTFDTGPYTTTNKLLMVVRSWIDNEEKFKSKGDHCCSEYNRYCFFGWVGGAYCELWNKDREWDPEQCKWKRLALCKDAQKAAKEEQELGIDDKQKE